MLPPAPVTFSTRTVWPRLFVIRSAMMRAIVSVGPPAENGTTTVTGTRSFSRSYCNGYMVSIGHIGPHVINGAMYQLQYDLLKDLVPVGMFVTNPQIIVSKNGLPSKDLKSLIEFVKGKPIAIATGGAGTPSHISGVYFQKLTGGDGN